MSKRRERAKALSKIYEERCRLSRTYHCKDGRRRVDMIFEDWKKTCQLARVKLEIKLGRKLKSNEDVDHIYGDFTNDRTSNLQALTKQENGAKAAWRRKRKRVRCMGCVKKLYPTRHQVTARASKKAGPFCSRKCSGSYGKDVQQGFLRKKRVVVTVKYYTRNKG